MKDQKHREAGRKLLNQLKERAKTKGITELQIAEKTGFNQPNVSRMFAGNFMPTLENFISLADAVEVEITMKLKD